MWVEFSGNFNLIQSAKRQQERNLGIIVHISTSILQLAIAIIASNQCGAASSPSITYESSSFPQSFTGLAARHICSA